MTVEFSDLLSFVPPTTGIGAAIIIFLYLLQRGERRDQNAFDYMTNLVVELKDQRDYWRKRAEVAERQLEGANNDNSR